MLTILVLTHNRKDKLKKCLSSIYSIYNNYIQNNMVNVVVCDNSSETYDDLSNIIQKYTNIKYINIRKYSGNIGYAYKVSINNITTKYTLIVEDDDLLCNNKLHNKIFNILKFSYDIISFSYKSIENNKIYTHMNFSENIQLNITNAPLIWNGEFKFDCCYYPTEKLKIALNTWLKDDIHMFDGSSDEAICILMLNNTYITHINECGLFITTDKLNESLNNIYMVIYSSRSYIKELALINNCSQEWIDKYQTVQLNIINSMSNIKYTYNDIFNNSDILQIEYNIKNMLKTNIKFNIIKTYIFTQMKLIKFQHI